MWFKLNWSVAKNPDGSILRRKCEGASLFDLDYIDVEWTHATGFPPDTVTVPVTHPPDIKFETRVVGIRKTIQDQVIVQPGTADTTIMCLLDEKRAKLAQALNIEP